MKPAPALLFLAAAALAVVPAPAAAPSASSLKLSRVVMLMRHGIRPPTSASPAPAGYTSDAWPAWPVDYGLLTLRGAAGVKLLGQADRTYFQARGLFGTGCAASTRISLKASGKQRAIRTAENWAAGFLGDCAVPAVAHPGEKDPDPIFHGLDDKPVGFDGARAWRDAMATAPKGGIPAEVRAHAAELQLLAKALNCRKPACPIFTQPSRLIQNDHDRPDLDGPIDAGSSISQTFLLEYLEGKPMAEVGWGRISRADIERLLRFHPLKFKYANRPDYVARTAAAPLAREVVDALTNRAAPGLTLLAGHDTNIADLGAFYRVHWAVPGYPGDDVPPGSALGFELLRDGKGGQYVRAFYRAQTMDQLRGLKQPVGRDLPYRQYIAIPGCGAATAPLGCRLAAFVRLTDARLGDR